ncbi:MAG: nucleotidyltransferase family protein [Thermodesulfobacteriota bacterium]
MDPLLKKKRPQILAIAKRHGVGRVRVFGSAARGQARPDSDIDLLVEDVAEPSPFFPGGLIADLEELLGRRVEVAEPQDLHRLIRADVLAEAKPL